MTRFAFHTDPATAPMNMVLSQIITNTVRDQRILDALATTPRERFVPEALAGAAYADEDLPLSDGRYLMAPLTVARLLDMAEITAHHRVLEIGTGSGYVTALLARLAGQVVSIEQALPLAQHASAMLEELGIKNAAVFHVPDMAQGYWLSQPYDLIVINGAVEQVPDAILQQLARQGGKLVTVKRLASRPGSLSGLGRALMVLREEDSFSERQYFDSGTPLLPGFEAATSFRF